MCLHPKIFTQISFETSNIIMHTVLVFLAIVAVALGDSSDTLIQRTDIRDVAGQISHSYAVSDGTSVQERGILKPTADGSDNVLVKEGSFNYYTPDGIYHKVEYVADETGFNVKSDDLPKQVVAPLPTF